jgi:hypothetical protein
MNAFYFDVTITGTALVYAESLDEAKSCLMYAGVMVAGNKLRGALIEVKSEDEKPLGWVQKLADDAARHFGEEKKS